MDPTFSARSFRFIKKGLFVLFDEGIIAFTRKLIRKFAYLYHIHYSDPNKLVDVGYIKWIKSFEPTSEELVEQRMWLSDIKDKPTFAVFCVVEKSKGLEWTIRSVLAQTYDKFQLHIVLVGNENFTDMQSFQWQFRDEPKIWFHRSRENSIREMNDRLANCEADFITFIKPGDQFAANALFECVSCFQNHLNVDLIYTDEDTLLIGSHLRRSPKFKSAFDPEVARAGNLFGDMIAIRAGLGNLIGWFDDDVFETTHYDLTLRAAEHARQICHIPKVMYHRLVNTDKEVSQPSMTAKIIRRHLDRTCPSANIEPIENLKLFKINYALDQQPLISVLIPNHEHLDDLRICVSSMIERSTYRNFEILILENNSSDPYLFEYYTLISGDPRVRVLKFDRPFNYSDINNFGLTHANGDYILFLNNDIEVITPNWLEVMLSHAIQADIGMVGARLYYSDNTIQHTGVTIGMGVLAGHTYVQTPRHLPGYMNALLFTKSHSAVTAACLLMRRSVFNEVGGLDPAFALAYGDVDLCLRVRSKGYRITCPVDAELFHFESKSRGLDDTPEKNARFQQECDSLAAGNYVELTDGDPYYNPNLDLFYHYQLASEPRSQHPRVLPGGFSTTGKTFKQ